MTLSPSLSPLPPPKKKKKKKKRKKKKKKVPSRLRENFYWMSTLPDQLGLLFYQSKKSFSEKKRMKFKVATLGVKRFLRESMDQSNQSLAKIFSSIIFSRARFPSLAGRCKSLRYNVYLYSSLFPGPPGCLCVCATKVHSIHYRGIKVSTLF